VTVAVLPVVAGAAMALGCGERPDSPAAAASDPVAPRADTSVGGGDGDGTSIEEALAFVAGRVSVPVVLPSVPEASRLVGEPLVSHGQGQIALRLPEGEILVIGYGRVGFDGCGPLHPRPVDVNGHPGVLETHMSRGRPSSAVVWPATIDHLAGAYSVSGQFGARRILAFARAMDRARTRARPGTPRGC
jgi:hypothetical protein